MARGKRNPGVDKTTAPSAIQQSGLGTGRTTTGRAAKIDKSRDSRVTTNKNGKLQGQTMEADVRLRSSMGKGAYYFEDSKGRTWFSEPLAVEKVTDKGIERVGAGALKKSISNAGRG